MKPRIAVFLQPQHAEYDQIRQAAIEAEKIGQMLSITGIIFIHFIKRMELNGMKGKEEKVNTLNVGQCFPAGER